MTRHVEIDLDHNKASYLKKLSREFKDNQDKLQQVEKIAKKRHADENAEIRRVLEDARQKMDEVARRLESLKEESEEAWPEGSRTVSRAYKQLEQAINSASSKIKSK